MATYIYDPSEQTTGIDPAGVGNGWVLRSGTITTSEISLATTPVGTKEWRMVSSSTNVRFLWEGVPNSTTDAQIVSLWRGPTNEALGNTHRISASANTAYYQGFRHNNTTAVRNRKWVDGTQSDMGSADHGISRATDKWLWVKTESVGTTHRIKAWEYNTTEPAGWQVEHTDSSIASGGVGIGDFLVSSGDKGLAWYSVGTGGDAAPLPGASIDPPVASGTFAPPTGTVNSAYSYATAGLFTGGTPTSYAVATGTLPAGITLNTSTGLISGTPTTAGTAAGVSITATNADGSATTNTASIVVNAEVFTRTIEISNITVANGENVTLTLTNPSGFSITPLSRSVPVFFYLNESNPPIASGTFAPPQGNVDSSYSYASSSLFTGGAPTSYALATGTLPAGLSLNTTTGVISGTPTTEQTATGLSITGTNAYGSATTNTASIVIGAALVGYPDFTPAYASEFSFMPSQDSDGFSIFTPSADSRIMYVSEAGNDTTGEVYAENSFADWKNPTGENAYATYGAALEQCRDGFPDYVCIRAGDTIQLGETQLFTASNGRRNGRNLSEPTVVCAYGTGARPILNKNIKAGFYRSVSSGHHVKFIAIQGIKFERDIYNPESANFVGWDTFSANEPEEFFRFTNGDAPGQDRDGIHIEDCDIRDCSIPLYIMGNRGSSNWATNIVVRRNMFTRIRGIGALWDDVDLALVEDNVYYKCGYLDYPDSPVTPSIFRHSSYITRSYRVLLRNNVSIAPSNIHWKFTANALNGTNTIVSDRVYCIDNLMMLGGVAAHFMGNPEGDNKNGVRHELGELSGNVAIGVGRLPEQDSAWGLEVVAAKDTFVRYNVIAQTGGAKTSGGFGVGVRNDQLNTTVSNNIAHNLAGTWDWFGEIGLSTDGTKTNVQYINNIEKQANAYYVNGTADINTFVTSIGLTGDYEEYGEYLLDRPRGVWSVNYSAKAGVDYFRAAYTPV